MPPLEDLSDAVERARAAQHQLLLRKTREAPTSARSEKELRSNGGSAETSRSVTSDRTQSESSQKEVRGASSDVKTESQPPKAFGGFMKGFLLSPPAKNSPSPASRAPASRGSNSNGADVESEVKERDVHQPSRKTGSTSGSPSVSGESDIPFLRAKPGAAESKGPVIPEVQQAMREAYPLLNTQGGHPLTGDLSTYPLSPSYVLSCVCDSMSPLPSLSSFPQQSFLSSSLPPTLPLFPSSPEWMTESLLEKIEKHPLLSRALRDPHLAQVLSQFQSNPRAALQAAAGNREMQQFLREFCSLMGDHFTELADKEERAGKPKAAEQQRKSTQNSRKILKGVLIGNFTFLSPPLPPPLPPFFYQLSPAFQSPAVDEEVKKALEKRAVREALSDPQIQRLISLLKEDPGKAQRSAQEVSEFIWKRRESVTAILWCLSPPQNAECSRPRAETENPNSDRQWTTSFTVIHTMTYSL